ncbi:SDR family NAD(P)-dependent oxidoreductase [Enterovirga sp.]|jgi:3-oxoacyl-[acyl-carrier protein] reductase|uniref:SDR family NAD(P)-dependent oxidoreductase n=1 Tax=Enterovirga sp. TaxID=2026350 RepID=UPI00262296FA|nr:SDR family NAD(P)-dependent oxidoreductase [Enterovirga sp.]MDB5591986.1 beta-ketoacyl-ACP reductase [Enterovirga sp.]
MTTTIKTAIVTGGGRGIGLATAVALAAKGFSIGLADLPGAELDAAVEQIRSSGAEAVALPGDVSDFAGVARSAKFFLERFGRVDVLVNNAGVSQPKGLLEITEAEWDSTLAINLKGCFNWCRNVAPAMVEAGRGRIVNISSVSATTGGAKSAVSKFAYCSAKAGILGMTRALAKELAPHVAVSAICPGSVETALTRNLIEANRQPIIDTIPLGRIGTPEDIAVVVAFLATVEPNFITGEIIDVDGGQWIN